MKPLYTAFAGGTQGVLENLLPHLMVDAAAVRNKPTFGDPLGARPRVVMQHRVSFDAAGKAFTELRFDVLGDDTMPWLDYQAAAVYLCVGWPHLFSLRGEG